MSIQFSSYTTLSAEFEFMFEEIEDKEDWAGIFFICKIAFNGLIKNSITSSLHKQTSHVSSAAHRSWSKSNAYLAGEYSKKTNNN